MLIDLSPLCLFSPVNTCDDIFFFFADRFGNERTGKKQSPVMENLNTPHELDRLKTTVLRQLQTLQGAPGVQMMEVSARTITACSSTQATYE